MAERRAKVAEVVATDTQKPLVEEVPTPQPDSVSQELPSWILEDFPERQAFNEHIKNLVALHSDQILRGLEQRLADLETIKPLEASGDLQFRTVGPFETNEPQYAQADEAPWYQPPGGV